MNKIIICLVAINLSFGIVSKANEKDSLKTNKIEDEVKHRVFANIFASHYYGLSENITPRSAFEMPTALLGYSATFSNKLKATLIYDVTRTTSSIMVVDDDGQPLAVNYFEGSKYTAFLKMAEIMYSVNNYIDFRIGQLLNTQYLTMQDKFWGYRYIYFTYQEVHRYGMPADFGAQVDLKFAGKFLNQVSVTNGEGPFRHQDENAKFLFSNNIEFRPTSELVFKLYTDYCPTSDTSSLARDKYAISAFFGYSTSQYRVGFEYNQVYNFGFYENRDFFGISTFASASLTDKIDLIARYDYINRSIPMNIENGNFLIAGFQYKLHKNLSFSLNLRALMPQEKYWVYSNFGVSF